MNRTKAIGVNNELKLNVNKQQDDINNLKDKCDIDDEDEVQKITAASTPMKKNKSMCVACNQTCAMENWFKKYPGRAHDPL